MADAAGTAPGYHVKAAAATRAGLAAAAVRQAAAVVDSEARRIKLAADVRRRRAATDAVERAVDSIDLVNGKVG